MTFHDSVNCGAALQAFAIQKQFNKLGVDSEFINYIRPRKIKLNSLISKSPIGMFHKWQDLFFRYYYSNNNFSNFSPFLKRGKIVYKSYKQLKTDPPDNTIYVSGSDQVWRNHNDKIPYEYFLDFGSRDTKRISIAASFGEKYYPESFNAELIRLLGNIDNISIRESNGVAYVASILEGIDKEINHLCDPTFLLSANEYYDYFCRNTNIYRTNTKSYIASYIMPFLSNKQLDLIDYIVNKYNMPLINLRNPDHGIRLKKYKNIIVTPGKWIYYVYNASFMICSSFHAVVFSLIFHKPFIVITPYKSERIYSLLEQFDLVDKLVISDEYDFDNNLFRDNIDWDFVDNIIASEKNKALNYIKGILDDICCNTTL
ncbi:MAG: polysaccharide pyruvyl transferase family protein [Bacteroidales bacterium]|nr:polysaccharide pyruvyl transferase family protein [Bacteroidales bacterium]